MSNQRSAQTYSASGAVRDSVTLRGLISYVKDAHEALIQAGDEDAAFRFEMMLEYLQQDVANGKPFKFKSIQLGL